MTTKYMKYLVALLLTASAIECGSKGKGTNPGQQDREWGEYGFDLSASPGVGATEFYVGGMSGNAVVPSVLTSASGKASFKAQGDSCRFRVELHAIHAVTAIHLHVGFSFINGPLMATLFDKGQGPASPDSVFEGWFHPGGQLLGDMRGNPIEQVYMDVHTQANPNGELRGYLGAPAGYVCLHMVGTESEPTVLRFKVFLTSVTGVTAVHLHSGGISQTGAVIATLYPGPNSGSTPGLVLTGQLTPADLSGTTMANLRVWMLQGLVYVDVHTAEHQSGELRGQADLDALACTLIQPIP